MDAWWWLPIILLIAVLVARIAKVRQHDKEREQERFNVSKESYKTELERLGKIVPEQDLEDYLNRLLIAEATMDRLFLNNQVVESMEVVLEKIPEYLPCLDKQEEEYCREYLRKKYSGAYKRYDEERLK